MSSDACDILLVDFSFCSYMLFSRFMKETLSASTSLVCVSAIPSADKSRRLDDWATWSRNLLGREHPVR